MAQAINVGIIGAGAPGIAHARGYSMAGGFRLQAVADLIPARRRQLMGEFGIAREYASAQELLKDDQIDAVSICLPNDLHQQVAVSALKAGKHLVCESPPARNAGEARKMAAAAKRAGKVLLFALPRAFGPHEQAAKQAIARGYIGEVRHVRAAWTRTRGLPVGTGWYLDRARAGGGAMIDLGVHMLELAWGFLGDPNLLSASAAGHSISEDPSAVEDSAFALLRFAGNRSLELSVAWALNQPPQQNGSLCRIYGSTGAIEVYTRQNAVLYRDFKSDGSAKATPLRPPMVAHHHALMKHFRKCIAGESQPEAGAERGVELMRMVDAIYKSMASGRSVDFKSRAPASPQTAAEI